jgi:lipopolysaccharide export system ATP-binding protein
VRKFLSIFGGSARQKANPAPGVGNIDLRTLAGSMAREEAAKLNGQTPKRPTRPAATPDGAVPRGQAAPPPRRREESMPEPPPAQTRRIPAEVREARSLDTRAPDTRAPGGAPGRAPAGRGQAPQGRDDGFGRQPLREGYLATFGLEKSFGSRKVVRGPSIYVRRGEAVGLLGPNGAGKTTVFYMITGLIKPDRGRIELDGHDVTRLPMYQRARLGIGYLPQEASIFRGLNVEENIRAVLEVTEPNRRKREADLNSLLAEFGLTKLRKSPSIALSGGERRRCEIARALATRPNYMLLDEPFAGIDPIAVGDIKTLVRHLTSRGIGVLITDHNVRETLALTDRAYIIYSGEVLREGRAADIVNDPEVRRLYLGEEFRM